jgi:hypothetical protein
LDATGLYRLYRSVNFGEGQRRCRLQPTCSYFAVQAIRRFGLIPGFFMGMARAQMEHSDQGGLLRSSVASDDRFIFHDSVEQWIHEEFGPHLH